MAICARLLVLAAAAGACGGDDPPAPPAGETIAAILESCLGDYRGRFADLAVELRDEPGAAPTVVLADRRGRLRVQYAGGETVVVAGGQGFAWRDGGTSEAIDAADRERAVRLEALCRAMLLAPLEGAAVVERTGPRTIALGDEWTLEHDGERPVRLASARCGAVEFVELARGQPALPRVVAIDGLGRQRVRILGDDVAFDDAMFTPPDRAPRGEGTELVLGPDGGPRAPRIERLGACEWLLVPDPGDWKGRRAACEELGSALHRAGQSGAGDPFLMRDVGRAWLVVPFRSAGGAAYDPRAGEEVRHFDGGPAAVVLAPPGEYAARIAAGAELLERFLATGPHTTRGPLRIVVNLFGQPVLTEGSEVERTTEIRLEQGIGP